VEILFYDGHCGLCHRGVRFVARADRKGRFRFAPLHGATFERSILPAARAGLPDSIVLRSDDGSLLTRSAAVVHILKNLGGGWRLLGSVFGSLPARWRDALYDAVAARRLRWFARPADSCPVLPPELRRRFDP